MTTKRITEITLLIVLVVTFACCLSETVEIRETTESYECLCVIRCCTHPLQKRSDVILSHNQPLVRHRRCCGCSKCDISVSEIRK